MRIAIMSTWNATCGIATYTAQLAKSLQELGHSVIVLAEYGDLNDRIFEGVESEPVWKRGDQRWSAEQIKNWLAQHEPIDVLHIQHEFGLFPWASDLVRLIKDERAKRRVVLTLHTVIPARDGMRDIADAADACIVHTPRGLDCLGMPYRGHYVHIPHGTPPANRIRKSLAREMLGIAPEQYLIVTPGFLSPSKNLEGTGAGLLRIIPRLKSLYWICGGAAPDVGYGNTFSSWVDARHNLRIRTRVLRNFLSDDELSVLLSAADLVIFNAHKTYYSTSGQVHLVIGYGLPILAVNESHYDDASKIGQTFEQGVPQSFIDEFFSLYESPELRRKLGQRALAYSRMTTWEKTAQRHLEVYKPSLSYAELAATEADQEERLA